MSGHICTWYVSKYVDLPGPGNPVGSRGFRLMSELARRGHHPLIVTSKSSHLTPPTILDQDHLDAESIDGVATVIVGTFNARTARSWRRVVSWLDFEWQLLRMPLDHLPRPDAIIVSSLSILTILNGFRLRRLFGARLVFEVRDIWPLTLTEEGGFSTWNPLVLALGLLERWGYRSADAIVGTMPNLGEHVEAVLGYPKPVACIPMGVSSSQTQSSGPLDPLVRAKIPTSKFLVTYAGTLGATNALHTLMECAAAAEADGDEDMHFLVVGDGDLKLKYTDEYGHLPNLTFLPKLPKEQVPAVLELSDVLYLSVHESKVWRYGQSLNKLIDYMASGQPIVASYTGYPSIEYLYS